MHSHSMIQGSALKSKSFDPANTAKAEISQFSSFNDPLSQLGPPVQHFVPQPIPLYQNPNMVTEHLQEDTTQRLLTNTVTPMNISQIIPRNAGEMSKTHSSRQ